MTSTDSDLWKDLLLAIEEGRVVPIVGRDLLVVEEKTGPCLFHHLVAQQLAAELKVSVEDLRPGFDPNDVVCAYKDFHGDPARINLKVIHILKGLKVPVPEPLRMLAEIEPFRLFVSTSYDTLLEEALASVRLRPPAVVAFPPVSSLTDFDDSLLQRHHSVVFQLLSRVSAAQAFAVTEGQVLEHMHDLMAGPPKKLIAKLHESHLLLLGVSFPDWLERFLLRLARAKPLWDSRPLMEIIADGGRGEPELALFLQRFSPHQSRLFTGGSPVDFVRELHHRWRERHPPGSRPAVSGPPDPKKPADMERGSIFISYASEDRDAAFRLADHLTGADLEVWVDRRLNPGDDYRDIIERHIRECCAFVPVLSRHTQQEDERWFRREWAQACDRARLYYGTDRGFLFPVVVDDTPVRELVEMRRELFRVVAVQAPNGEPTDELITGLRQAQRSFRSQFARA